MSDLFPKAVLSQHLVMLGKTGSGKSSALRFMVEGLLTKGKRVCVIDPKGDWWGLKVAADGKGPGQPVILFGDFKNTDAQDVPINDRSGKHIAELVSDGNRPCVIGLRGWTQGGMTRFWIDFASTLFSRNAGELYFVGDEFHNFAPKQWKGQADKDTPVGVGLHWANRLLSEGRGLGLVCLLASQRPQKVHNDTLTSCETLVAMRVIHKADRTAVKDWIDGNGDPELGKKVLDSLAGMPRGDAWIWSPEIDFGPKQITFPMFGTFDSFAPPQLQKRVSDKGWAGVDLKEVRTALADAVKEAEANDPKLLRAKIADLSKQLSRSASAVQKADPAALEKAKNAGIEQGRRESAAAIKERDRINGLLVSKMSKAAALLHVNGEATPKVDFDSKFIPKPIPVAAGKKPAAIAVSRSPAKEISLGEIGGLGKAERSILTAIYWLRSETITPAKVGFYADYTAGSGSFNNALGRLRSSGLLQGWQITQAGIDEAEQLGAGPKPTGNDLRDWLRRKLGKAENSLLDALCEAHPNRMTDDELGEASGYTSGSGSFNNALGRLRSIEAAEGYARSGGTKASDVFFEA